MKYFFSYINDIPEKLHNTLLSRQHILALAMVVCIWFLIIYLFKNKTIVYNWRVIRTLSLLLPIFECAQMIWYESIGKFSFGYTLPLHLCSLMSIVLPIMAFSKIRLLQEYAYAIGLAPALMTLLTPDVYYYPALSFIFIQTMMVHGIICLIPLFMVINMGFRPDVRKLPKVIVMLVGFALVMIPINYITNGNYFFLRYPAQGSPMESFAAILGSPGYLLLTFLMGCVLWAVSYAPFIIMQFATKSRKKRSEKSQPKATHEKQYALIK